MNYLINRNVFIDPNSQVLLRGLIEQTFLCNENKLKKIFDDIFEVAKGCLSMCNQQTNIFSNIIPQQK